MKNEKLHNLILVVFSIALLCIGLYFRPKPELPERPVIEKGRIIYIIETHCKTPVFNSNEWGRMSDLKRCLEKAGY